ncbi:heavy metal-associated isoprenylated plant protein 30-like [Momordica charantia]|uniref:Heavy metal-associated isoprenylated plant protein 30-like n=1 Tax=Momordica charantia TaxID=3673 RepID=A0A6J1DUQ9_MOMCH|nr:heavy metal-associated isoprenylated plant protein 30-like [Momordica charantia]
MEVVDLKVCLHCKACEKALRKVLCKIRGVKCVEMNMALNKITVLGYMDRKVVVKEVRKTGRRAEVLPSPPCRRLPPSHRRTRPAAAALKCLMPSCFL